MRIGILTTDSQDGALKEEDSRLAETARKTGHRPEIITAQKCSIVVCNKNPRILYEGRDISGAYDIIIPRINIPHTQLGLTVLRQFQAIGVYTTDEAESLEIGRDKLLCNQRLIQNDVPVPRTGYAHSQNDYDAIIDSIGKLPLVLKMTEGTEGVGVFLARNKKEAKNLLGSFGKLGTRIIVQEFIEESAGKDLRCFVVGDRVVATMRREAQDGDFRANVALGAKSFKEKISSEEENIVLGAAHAIGINIAGIDLIRSERGPLIIEINVAPDFCGTFGLEATSKIDVASKIIRFAVQERRKTLEHAHTLQHIAEQWTDASTYMHPSH